MENKPQVMKPAATPEIKLVDKEIHRFKTKSLLKSRKPEGFNTRFERFLLEGP
jgi:hypothetical protein